MKAIGIVLLVGGLALLPVPAAMLFGVSYAAAAKALAVGVVAGLLAQFGAALAVKS